MNVNELSSITMLTLTMTNSYDSYDNNIASKFSATICILFIFGRIKVLIIVFGQIVKTPYSVQP